MTLVCLCASALLVGQVLPPLPLEETVRLNPRVVLDDTTAILVGASDLAFTAKSVTRGLSILGWSSERYDIEVGEVLMGSIEDDMVSAYVFPQCLYSHQFSMLDEGSGLIVLAMADSTHEHMEGFRTSEGDWYMLLMPVDPEKCIID